MHHYNLVNENQVYYYIEQYRSQLDEKIDKRVYVWFIYTTQLLDKYFSNSMSPRNR